MRSLVKIISAIAFIGSVAWFIRDGGYEPMVTGLGALATLIGLLVAEERGKDRINDKSKKDKTDERKVEDIHLSARDDSQRLRPGKPDEEKVANTQVIHSISPNIGSLSGVVDIKIPRGAIHEVFYKRPFKRIPYLETQRGILGTLGKVEIVEQRKDGFKVSSNDFDSINIKWTAEAEFED